MSLRRNRFLIVVLPIAMILVAGTVEAKKKKKEAEGEALPGLKQLKKVVAVADFKLENLRQEGSRDLAANLGDLLVDKLVNTGKFIVVERDRMRGSDLTLDAAAEKEQAAKQAGMSRGSGAEAGKAAAAQALFSGSVVGAGQGSSFGGGGGGFGKGGFGLGGLGVGTMQTALVVRWYDTTSLEIKGSHECSKTQFSLGLFGGGAGGGGFGGGGGKLRSPLHKTFGKAMDKCVKWVVDNMEKLPWEGKILKGGEKIYLNAGGDAGIKVGDTFAVYKAGEELVDPDTGLKLGSEMTLSGQVQVTHVEPKFAIAAATSGSGFGAGDIIREQ